MITFSSPVGPDIMMFDKDAHHMMELMGKEPDTRGVVTVEQLPEAIARLKAAIAHDKTLQGGASENAETESAPRIGLAQRALPLVELLELSLNRGKPVTWGV